jgi:hypothetical protein
MQKFAMPRHALANIVLSDFAQSLPAGKKTVLEIPVITKERRIFESGN